MYGFKLVLEITVLFFRLYILYVEAFCRFFLPSLLPRKRLHGETVLITGSGHGLGKEMCLLFAKHGAIVVMWDINKTTNEAVANDIKVSGGVAYPYECDVTSPDAVKNTAALVKRDVGKVTILVNNAGILNGKSILNLRKDQIRKCIDINLTSHFWMLQEFLPDMIELNHGHIIGICSNAGLKGTVNLSDYVATKFAVRGLMDSVAEELRFHHKATGVNVTTVFAHWIDTGMSKKMRDRFPSLSKLTKPDEAARQVIDGIMTDARNVYIPNHQSSIMAAIIGVLPSKGASLLVQFIGSYLDEHD